MLRTNHVALHSFAIFGASLIDILASLVGAYKTDGFDGRMVTDEVHSYNNTWKKKLFCYLHIESGSNVVKIFITLLL